MVDLIERFWRELAARPGGPLAFRFYLQPLVAVLFALRDGLRDARNRRPAYFWALVLGHGNRRELARTGYRSVSRVFFFAAAIDVVYQIIVLRGLRPVETLVVATLLALVPYVLLRGPVNRLARHTRWMRESHGPAT
nr:MAG: hypothetical protein DIU78_06420 [Pseudomonadota bacterium]